MEGVSFTEFYRAFNRIRSENDVEEAAAEGGEEDQEEEKKEGGNVVGELDGVEPEVLVATHGAYFQTAEGAKLREHTLAEGTYFPKKKGDIRLLSTEPVPIPAVFIRPKTAEALEQQTQRANSRGKTGVEEGGGSLGMDSETYGENDELYFGSGEGEGGEDVTGQIGIVMMDEGVERGGMKTAPVGGSSRGRSASPSASMSIAELREIAATGSGRNAVRAKSLLDKEAGVRLRAGERPADKTINGEKREKPVRILDRAKGSTNVEYQRLDKDSVSGRQTPDVSLRSLSPSPPPTFVMMNTMEVIPESVNFGFMKVGQVLAAKISVNNVGAENARYQFFVSGESDGYDFSVEEVPRGVIAAGIREFVTLNLRAKERCEVRGTLVIKSQFDVAEVRLLGNIVEEEEIGKAKGEKRSKQVWVLGEA